MTSKDLINQQIAPVSHIGRVFDAISRLSKKTEKEALLKQHTSPLMNLILSDTYGGAKYYIKKYSIDESKEGRLNIDDNYNVFNDLLQNLSSRKLTGNEAINQVVMVMEMFVSADRPWLARILDGNLKIGVGNKFSQDSSVTKKYPCALANVLEKAKGIDILDGTWFVSQKLDGCRCHAHVDCDAKTVKFISRQGKEFTTLDKLAPEVLTFMSNQNLKGKWVLDGELCIVHDDGSEDFYALMKEIRKKNHTIENPRYKVFDIITADVFWEVSAKTVLSPEFSIRNMLLNTLARDYNGSMIDVIEQQRLTCQDDLDLWMKRREEGNWEGLMVRKDTYYVGARTNFLLKIKPFADAEYVIKDIVAGDMTYNTDHGSEVVRGVSALLIEHKGNEVRVGSGMTRAQRELWYANPNLIVGKTATIKYFSESQDTKTGAWSLRFPTLKYVYEDGRTV
jgi:ATP-dependent DNA ligase